MPRLRPATSIRRQIRAIRQSLRSIIGALERLGPALDAAGRAADSTPAAARPKRRISPQRRAALKLQGRYIGHMRNLKPRQKAQVKAMKAAKGIRAAIQLAQKLG